MSRVGDLLAKFNNKIRVANLIISNPFSCIDIVANGSSFPNHCLFAALLHTAVRGEYKNVTYLLAIFRHILNI